MTPRRKKLLTMAVLLVIVAAAAAFGVWRMLGDAPEEVSLAEAVADAEAAAHADDAVGASASESDTGGDTSSDAGSAADDSPSTDPDDDTADSDGDADAASDGVALTAAELDGTWAVDAETGEFTLEDATGSFAGFRVDEELARIGAFTAVGRTGDISGSLEIADEHVTSAEIEVDLTTLRTDDSHRDHPMREVLDTGEFPMAAFTLTEPIELPAGSAAGEPFSGSARGDLTIKGVTNTAVFDLQAQLVGDVIVVVGSSEVVFGDYGVPTPSSASVLSVDDHGVMEFQLYFAR